MKPGRVAVAALLVAALQLSGCASDAGRHSASTRKPPPSTRVADGDVWRVARGDTLYGIAFRNHLDYRDLARWNGIGPDYLIRVGQVLRLTPPPDPAGRGPASARPAPLARPASPASATPMFSGSGSWEWPTRGTVTRRFAEGGSKGLDIAGSPGQLVLAARGGRVVYSGAALKGYGELVIVKHDEQYLSAYGYNRRRLVEEGETVGPGQPIAELGVGPENRPILHFEIRDRGQPIDPGTVLPRR